MRLAAIVVATCLTLTTVTANAQAALRGSVIDDSTGAALSGATITVRELARRFTSNDDGAFAITGLAAGRYTLDIRLIGYRPKTVETEVAANRDALLDIALVRSPTRLAPVTVTGRKEPITIHMKEFERRRTTSIGGHFLTEPELRKQDALLLSSVLRQVTGTRMVRPGSDSRYWAIATNHRTLLGGAPCYMQIYLDGIRIYRGEGAPPNIDDFRTGELRAIEIYPGAASTPGEFGGPTAGCGTLVLWTVGQ
jgi:hypothetical protein